MPATYQQLCPVCFGVGAIAEIGQKAKEYGAEKAFCIYDQGVKMSGIADKVIGCLKEAGVAVDCYDGVLPDAPDTMINEIGAKINGKGYRLVVGIGGGSSLDTAKAVSVLADRPLPIRQYFMSGGAGPMNGGETKLILVPTSSGTGSEVTIMSVVHDTERHVKDAVLRPADLAIVDPELTVTAPPSVTAACALDAMSHAVEAYTSAESNPRDDLLAIHAVKLVAEHLEAAYKDGSNIEARTALSLASNIAGIAFSDTSVHAGHCAAHEMGLKLKMPHGAACAIALPAVIEFCADALPEKTRNIAEALGVDVTGVTDAKTLGRCAADAVRTLMRKTGIKSLKELGHSREDVLACAKGAIENNWFYIMSPKPIDVELMKSLLAEMYEKY